MSDIRICFFGDSFVQGVCDEARQGFPGRLATELPAQHSVFNQGVRRDTSGDIAARWQNEAACRLPAASLGRVVFSFGTNDCVIENGSTRLSRAETLSHARGVLTRAKEQWPVLWIGPPPSELEARSAALGRLSRLNADFASLASELDIPYLDLLGPLSKTHSWWAAVASGDGTHPNGAGYAQIASLIARWSAWQDLVR